MPCYTVQTTTVEFTVGNEELLQEALIEAGLCVNHGYAKDWARKVIERGALVVAVGREDLADKLKMTYAKLAVQKAAERGRWQVQHKGQNKYTLARR